MPPSTDPTLERLCRRFEIAVSNFGRSCIGMRANEKAFQAWYAACVIQEFGLSRVYREVHLNKPELFELAQRHSFTSALEEGNELFPDLSVSWERANSSCLPSVNILALFCGRSSSPRACRPRWFSGGRQVLAARGGTVLQSGDHVYVFFRSDDRPFVELQAL